MLNVIVKLIYDHLQSHELWRNKVGLEKGEKL